MNGQREVRSLSISIALFVLAAFGCGAPTQLGICAGLRGFPSSAKATHVKLQR